MNSEINYLEMRMENDPCFGCLLYKNCRVMCPRVIEHYKERLIIVPGEHVYDDNTGMYRWKPLTEKKSPDFKLPIVKKNKKKRKKRKKIESKLAIITVILFIILLINKCI